MNLRIPGPTPLPPSVLKAMSQPIINHRGPEFAAMLREITARLKEIFRTKNDVFILTSSGTGGLEAAIANLISPGDKVLAASAGFFGDRLAAIAEAFGAEVTKLDFPWGRAVDATALRRRLKVERGFKLVLVVHNETSTGVANDLAAIAEAVRSLGDDRPLLLVDAVSSLGAIELRTDEWGCDAVVTGSQKALMAPPGLALVSLSERAWRAAEGAKAPRFYWDFRKAREYAQKGQTPFTPAISTLYGLREALRLITEEGLDNVIARHRRIGRYTREGIKALGLRLFADEAHASDTVTAVRVPEGMDADRLLARLREEHGVVLGGGQGPLRGKIFRIGHMGYVSEEDIEGVLEALRKVLRG